MPSNETRERFEREVLPLLGAAYNLARWLLRDANDAEDAVQDAMIRAYRFFDRQRGDNPRAWLLAIVRNTCFTWHGRNRRGTRETLDALEREPAAQPPQGMDAATPESLLSDQGEREQLAQAMAALPAEFREVLVLRELEGLSYKEIGAVVDLPMGTVMSRLHRARNLLREALTVHPWMERQRG